MKGEIVLVQPKAGDYEYVGIRPPDSLLSIAAIPHQQGYKVKIVDQRVDKEWKSTLRKHLKTAICVGTTAMTGPQIRYALEISKFVKENSEVPVIWGGVHASLLPEETMQNKYIDIVLKGEGDYAFFEIAKAIEKDQGNKDKNELRKVRGIYYKDKNGAIKKTIDRDLIQDLDKLPNLPYELLNLNNYYGFDIKSGKSITMMTSRGCPFHCGFCYNTVYYHNKWRGMSAERTIENIKYVVDKFGIKNIYFQDDNFCADLKRFENIVNGLIKENINVTWGLLGARINSLMPMSPDFLQRVIKAGCINIDIGIESGNQRVLNLMAKGIRIPDILAVNRKLAKHFSKIKYTYVVGIPTETEAELMDSVKLALRLEKDNPHALNLFNIYCVYPGTELYGLAKQYGFREPKNLEQWSTINFEQVFLRYPWLTKKRIKMLTTFKFTSFFQNRNIGYKIGKRHLKALAALYRPIAKFRFKNNFHHFLIERKIADMLTEDIR